MKLKKIAKKDLKKGLWIKRIRFNMRRVKFGQWYKIKRTSYNSRRFEVYGSSFVFTDTDKWRMMPNNFWEIDK